MNTEERIRAWKAEESIAHIHGWDFSHIDGRYTEQDDLPWDYRETVLRYLTPEKSCWTSIPAAESSCFP